MCELCDSVAYKRDADMGFLLCKSCYAGFNGTIVEMELDEVYE